MPAKRRASATTAICVPRRGGDAERPAAECVGRGQLMGASVRLQQLHFRAFYAEAA